MSAPDVAQRGGDQNEDDAVVPARSLTDGMASDGECVLYSPVRDEAAALNRTATEIWELCDGRTSVRGIAGALAGRYGVDPAMLREDVVAALVALESRGFVTLGRACREDVR